MTRDVKGYLNPEFLFEFSLSRQHYSRSTSNTTILRPVKPGLDYHGHSRESIKHSFWFVKPLFYLWKCKKGRFHWFSLIQTTLDRFCHMTKRKEKKLKPADPASQTEHFRRGGLSNVESNYRGDIFWYIFITWWYSFLEIFIPLFCTKSSYLQMLPPSVSISKTKTTPSLIHSIK